MANIDPIRVLSPNPAPNAIAGTAPDPIEALLDQGVTSFPDELEAAKQNQGQAEPNLDFGDQAQGDSSPNLQNLPVPGQVIPTQTANIADTVDVSQLAQAVPTLPQVEIAQELSLESLSPVVVDSSPEDPLATLAEQQAPNPVETPVAAGYVQASAQTLNAPVIEPLAANQGIDGAVAVDLNQKNAPQTLNLSANGLEMAVPTQMDSSVADANALRQQNASATSAAQEAVDTQVSDELLARSALREAKVLANQDQDGIDISNQAKPAEALSLTAKDAKVLADAALAQAQQTSASPAQVQTQTQTQVSAQSNIPVVNQAEVANDPQAVAGVTVDVLSPQVTNGSVAANPQASRVAADAMPEAKAVASNDDGPAITQSLVPADGESVLAANEDGADQVQAVRAENAKVADANLAKPGMAEELMAKEIDLKLDNQENIKVSSNSVAEPTGDPTNRTITSVFNQELRLSQSPHPLRMEPQQASFVTGPLHVEVMRVLREGGGRVIMELTPPDQGTIQLDLRLDGNGKAYLIVEGASDSTKARLEQGGSQLKEQLAQMGLSLSLDMRDRSGQSDHVPFAFNPGFAAGNAINGNGAEALTDDLSSLGRSGITPDGRISIYA
jgi:hypothetical protein